MTRLTRRALALGLAALPLPALAARPAIAPLSADDRLLVDKAATYLQGLTEAKGRFVQTDARGTSTQGTVFLKRPGKARFAYEAPSGLLVVADGANVSVADSRLKTFDRYPLMATPLSIFLARQIKLDRGVVISDVTRLADGFTITARDGKKQAEGQITLTFSNSPMALIGWTVSDAQGQATRIRLTGLQRTSGLAPTLFVLNDPRPKSVGRGKM
ncbi:MAG: outer-membrane lipoprotein carrier protein LolA [Phenylobacterium sp.]|jgi:outer membrane lipoprotein-sorting protein|uniref:LolA family protein n=1 Tax=Phenylobacterium sp. TaxID=1871053 RepID=UPI00271F007F|nr:outer-membrane lipoprotein carrier protein LolA [Phenylobacterium sp.]MDO8321950.1 outer-membrane lipoprotein carrier protein LolA [Phenylobacterium sp.]MDO8913277.1 outer-membrane lipoprotein carrier protein LolA [Phenylobacterium sp.]MDO9245840.1 outer-membrane lipoprotein carrier protein LolA [Phenylobacterium sp.]MDP2011105.1 outer-membrane lipoprotein carrier protein LolA [Phenylobacterium sp.]MDP3100121.1 outer-membrane lipoprotein carrier protein LolA [Phenylobacterium sp.]